MNHTTRIVSSDIDLIRAVNMELWMFGFVASGNGSATETVIDHTVEPSDRPLLTKKLSEIAAEFGCTLLHDGDEYVIEQRLPPSFMNNSRAGLLGRRL